VTPYLERFQSAADVAAYDEAEYGSDSYSSFIWELQKPVLRDIIEHRRTATGEIRLLDFACGTGRILSFVEDLVEDSEGVDLSSSMIERAAGRCRKSRLIVGDIAADSSIARRRYEVITAFRFLLNAEDSVRLAVLRALRSRIDEEHGILIANIHGNSFSLRHLALKYRRWKLARIDSNKGNDVMLAEMTMSEIVDLLRKAGFEVAQTVGFGVMPKFLYRTPAKRLEKWIDRIFSARSFTTAFSIDLMFVCTPVKPSA
jgi:SAM-dependent methyltransferase